MEVNEKYDVYSFGVLTLEVIMKNHPGDLVSFLSSLATTSTTHNIQLKDILNVSNLLEIKSHSNWS